MTRTVQARIDEASERTLERLERRLGVSRSEVLRRAIRLADHAYPKTGPRRIVGLGRFASGIPDLGSNKEHLKGFGR